MSGISTALAEIGAFVSAGRVTSADLDPVREPMRRYYLAFFRGLRCLEGAVEADATDLDHRLLSAAMEDLALRRRDLAEALQPLLLSGAAADRK